MIGLDKTGQKERGTGQVVCMAFGTTRFGYDKNRQVAPKCLMILNIVTNDTNQGNINIIEFINIFTHLNTYIYNSTKFE